MFSNEVPVDTLNPKLIELFKVWFAHGAGSEAFCVADCLNSIAENGDGQDSDNHMRTCAEQILNAAQAVIDALGKHRVWIIWGKTEKPAPTMYEFDTAVELAAFLEGVDQAAGYLEFAQYDTLEEANAAYQQEQDEENDDDDETES